MRLAAVLAAAVLVTGCSETARDEVARDAARKAVRPVLAERFPGIPLEPAVDCVIDNASSGEILSLAADAVTGPTPRTAETVLDIAARPDTIRCLATDGLPALLR